MRFKKDSNDLLSVFYGYDDSSDRLEDMMELLEVTKFKLYGISLTPTNIRKLRLILKKNNIGFDFDE